MFTAESRALYIGASECPAIWGCDPYASPLDVYLKKLEGMCRRRPELLTERVVDLLSRQRPRDAELERLAEIGHDLEPNAAKQYTRDTGYKLREVEAIVGAEPWDVCHPDRLAETLDGPVNVQIKSKFSDGARFEKPIDDPDYYGEPGTNKVPDKVGVQVLDEMRLLRHNGIMVARTDVVLMRDGTAMRPQIFPVPWNADLAAEVAEQKRIFWTTFLEPFWTRGEIILPPATKPDDVKILWPRSREGKRIELKPEQEALLEEYFRRNALANEEDKALKELRGRVNILLEDSEIVVASGREIATYRNQQASRVDTDALKADGLYEKYAKVSVSRVLRQVKAMKTAKKAA